MDLIVDEPVRCIHLAPSLAVGALERVLSFKCSASIQSRDIAVPSGWDRRPLQSRQPSQFARINLTGDMRGQKDGRVAWLGNDVLR